MLVSLNNIFHFVCFYNFYAWKQFFVVHESLVYFILVNRLAMLRRLVFHPKFVNFWWIWTYHCGFAKGSTCSEYVFLSRFNSILECTQLKGHRSFIWVCTEFLTYDTPLCLFLPEFKTISDDVRAYAASYGFALANDW